MSKVLEKTILIQSLVEEIEEEIEVGLNIEDLRALNNTLDYFEAVVCDIDPEGGEDCDLNYFH